MKQAFIDIWKALVFVWNGAPKDPKRFATDPPKGWATKPVEVPEIGDRFEIVKGGFAVGYDGQMIYSTDESRAAQRAKKSNAIEVLTPQEVGEMQVYKVSATQTGLFNFPLAIQIKPHWKAGKKPKEIGLLVGCSESTAKQYCICFSRANKP